MPDRPRRFGANCSGAPSRDAWTAQAHRLESLGFDILLVPDHFLGSVATTPLLAAAAMVTERLRIGSLVYDNDFRHPALLAREAAAIDVLSGGRMELGVGAGWLREEYEQTGISWDPPAVRAARLEEAIEIIRRLFGGEVVDFEGVHYHVRGLAGGPLPLQEPLPIFIGGGGRRLIGLAGRRADIVGLAPRSLRDGGLDLADLSAEAMDAKVDWLEAAVAESGRDDGGPERSLLLQAVAPSHEHPGAASSPHFLIGTVDEQVAAVERLRERWAITYLVCFDRDVDAFSQVMAAVGRT